LKRKKVLQEKENNRTKIKMKEEERKAGKRKTIGRRKIGR
jgi:hypothetical protein